jgi:hypothetical protein
VWGLIATLHLPWLDAAKSYRPVFTGLSRALPEDFNCVADIRKPESLRLRESERGLAHYMAGVSVEHVNDPAETSCDFLVVELQLRRHPDGLDPGPEWELIWEGQRPADERDRFLLFARRGRPSG